MQNNAQENLSQTGVSGKFAKDKPTLSCCDKYLKQQDSVYMGLNQNEQKKLCSY